MNRLLLTTMICLALSLTGAEPGPLVIVGGGSTPASVHRTLLEISGGKQAIIAVLPQASSRAERGQSSVELFLKLGAKEAYIVKFDDSSKSKKLIDKATAVWFPGGSQAQLYEEISKAGLIDHLQARHKSGIPFGGTSAGAAIMSERMIPRAPEERQLIIGNTPIQKGLGLVPELILDQHFIARARTSRLLSAVLDQPDLIGVGIGESTAIVVRDGQFRVIGTGSVVIIDARKSTIHIGKPQMLQSGSNIDLHILKSGQRFRYK